MLNKCMVNNKYYVHGKGFIYMNSEDILKIYISIFLYTPNISSKT